MILRENLGGGGGGGGKGKKGRDPLGGGKGEDQKHKPQSPVPNLFPVSSLKKKKTQTVSLTTSQPYNTHTTT